VALQYIYIKAYYRACVRSAGYTGFASDRRQFAVFRLTFGESGMAEYRLGQLVTDLTDRPPYTCEGGSDRQFIRSRWTRFNETQLPADGDSGRDRHQQQKYIVRQTWLSAPYSDRVMGDLPPRRRHGDSRPAIFVEGALAIGCFRFM